MPAQFVPQPIHPLAITNDDWHHVSRRCPGIESELAKLRMEVIRVFPKFRAQLRLARPELEGFEVEVAHDGGQALELATANPPDLILLDVMMPGVDGVEVGGDLRAGVGAAFVSLTSSPSLRRHGCRGLFVATKKPSRPRAGTTWL